MTTRPLPPPRRLLLRTAIGVAGWSLTACADLSARWKDKSPLSDGVALQASVLALELLPAAGPELRFMLRLRLQNPGGRRHDFEGLSVSLALREIPFASGASAQPGSVPRFGELRLAVPLSLPAEALARQGLVLQRSDQRPPFLPYDLQGRLGGAPLGGWVGGLFGDTQFAARGELAWPPAAAGAVVAG